MVDDEDPAIAHVRAIQREFRPSVIERMEIHYVEEGPLLTLVLRPAHEKDPRRVTLSFHDVADLSFGPGIWFPHLSLLEIDSIKDRHWEGKHYAVHNDEQDNELSFYCRYFDMAVTAVHAIRPVREVEQDVNSIIEGV